MKQFILTLALASALAFTACGKDTPDKITLTGVYNGTPVEIGALSEGEQLSNLREMYASDGVLHLVGSVMSEAGMEQVILTMDAAGKWERTVLPITEQARAMASSEEGYLFVTSEFDMTTFTERFVLMGADPDEVLWEKPLGELFELPERYHSTPMIAGHDGAWYVAVEDTLLSLDADGTVLASDVMTDSVRGLFAADDGLHVWGQGFHSIIDGDAIREDAAWKSAMEGVNTVIPGGGYDFCKTSEMGLYGVHAAEGTSELLMNWVSSGIPAVPGNIAVMSEDVVYIYRSDYADTLTGERGLWRYEKCPEDALPERQIIRVTYSENGRGKIPLAAVQYNKSQAEYFVVCEEYSATGGDYVTMAEGISRMLMDGSVGDIVELESLTELETYGAKGYLADLNTLTGDLIAADDIFGCVRTACETDGKLYGIPQEFALATCAVKSGALDAYGTWDLSAFMELYDDLTAEGRFITANLSAAGITEFLRETLMGSFVDLEAGESRFDSEEFRAAMEFLASLPEKNACGLNVWNENHYVTDEVFLFEATVGCYSEWAMLMAAYRGEDFDAVGYPSSDGGAVKLEAEKYYAISEQSSVKEGAMEFLAYFLSPACTLDEMRGMRKIPALKSSMEAWNESEGKMYYYFENDNFGGWSGDTKPFDPSRVGPGMEIFAGDPAVVDALYDFLDTARVARPLPSELQTIINEELAAYFAGDKSADETAKLIDNRVGTYLAEKK
ncbi:MAG: extracellular solute-binding protein [Ruminococcaceae bacterium]|nr:extracellular solute-binding protein [Oscillospiraceae bacterium]